MKQIVIESIIYLIVVLVFAFLVAMYARQIIEEHKQTKVEAVVEQPATPTKDLYIISPNKEA